MTRDAHVRVVAHRTAATNVLLEAVRKRAERGPATFHLLVPQHAAMRDPAVVEQATADAVPEGTDIAELADLDFDGDARAQANDLSLADGRFAPGVLDVSARRAVAAWAQGIDGDRDPLESLADGSVVQELLDPGDRSGKTRLVVRGSRVKEIRITALDANADPPAMSLVVHLSGRRYVEDRDTTKIVSGSQSRESHFIEHWTLALSDDGEQPWRIVSVGTPGACLNGPLRVAVPEGGPSVAGGLAPSQGQGAGCRADQ